MLFIQSYKGFRIYQDRTNNFLISYLHSFNIWKRKVRSIKSAKYIINRALKKLKGSPIIID